MRTAVLVLTWNGNAPALRCLAALVALNPAPDQVLVVDNASGDGTPEMVAARFPDFALLRNQRNLGFSGGMNAGIAHLLAADAPPDVIILLNQDTEVDPGWLGAITAPLDGDAQIGAVGCKIRYPDGTLQHAGVTLERPRTLAHHIGWHEPDTGQYDTPREAELLTAAALALRTEALRRVGFLDEGFAPAYFEDLDLCVRLRQAGYTLRYEPRATLLHQESLSLRDELTRSAYYNRGRLRFVLKHDPLPFLLGPFAEAERAFLHRHGNFPEARALRWAYAETLAALPEIMAARRARDPELPADAEGRLDTLLIGLRRELAFALNKRALACADELANL